MSNNNKNIKDKFSTTNSIDKLIHEPARLKIMAHLYVIESADFLFMMRQTGLTFGNLSTHMSKLESVGYIKIIKMFVALGLLLYISVGVVTILLGGNFLDYYALLHNQLHSQHLGIFLI